MTETNKKEITNKISFGVSDTKAKRKLNVSNKVANITAENIERGVSIETLETLNVPVMRYHTQITIHGKLPSISDYGYVNGYKALIKNKNGSMGVKYSAIDGEKKALIKETQRYCKCRMHFHENSQGAELVKGIDRNLQGDDQKTAVSSLYDSIPTDLFIGNKYIMRDIYGGYYVIAGFQAIPQKNLDAFIAWFTSGAIISVTGIDTAREEYNIKQEARAVQVQKERDDIEAKKQAVLQPIVDNLTALGFERYDGKQYDGLHIIQPKRLCDDGSVKYRHIFYKKYGTKHKRSYVISKEIKGVNPGKWNNPDKYYRGTAKGYKRTAE